tara:strand:- start:46 stop:603 length:558 start_codon:yes stop_codon:yes gene_type:complete
MTPILGIMASGISGALWAPGKDYDSIATVTVGSPVSSISFSSIPATYKHLQIRSIGRSVSTNHSINLNFNGDTTSTAYWHMLYGTGSSANAYAVSTAYMFAGYQGRSTDAANIFSANVTDILDYANTNKYKTIRTLGGYDTNGSGELGLSSGSWASTSAVTSIVLTTGNAANFAQYSSFALYGVK